MVQIINGQNTFDLMVKLQVHVDADSGKILVVAAFFQSEAGEVPLLPLPSKDATTFNGCEDFRAEIGSNDSYLCRIRLTAVIHKLSRPRSVITSC